MDVPDPSLSRRKSAARCRPSIRSLQQLRLVSLTQGPPPAAVERALLAAAIAHYRRAGKDSFLLFADVDAATDVPSSLGFQSISAGFRWMAHREVVPAWAAYLDSLLAAPERAP
jgi:hypothetical protein